MSVRKWEKGFGSSLCNWERRERVEEGGGRSCLAGSSLWASATAETEEVLRIPTCRWRRRLTAAGSRPEREWDGRRDMGLRRRKIK